MAGEKRTSQMELWTGYGLPISLALQDRVLLFLDQSLWVEMALFS